MIKCFRDRPGVRAPGPHRREDDRAVHARLHGAARADLPQARRVRDGRHGGADPLAQGRGRPTRRRSPPPRPTRSARRRPASTAPGSRTPTSSPPRRPPSTRCSATSPTRSTSSARTSRVTPEQLLDAESTPGEITEEGLRNDVSVGFQYISFWLGGRGAAGINNLMEDAATAEISRSQIWQWVKHGKFTKDHVRQVLDEEMAKIRDDVGEETWQKGRPDETPRDLRARLPRRRVPRLPHPPGLRVPGLTNGNVSRRPIERDARYGVTAPCGASPSAPAATPSRPREPARPAARMWPRQPVAAAEVPAAEVAAAEVRRRPSRRRPRRRRRRRRPSPSRRASCPAASPTISPGSRPPPKPPNRPPAKGA